MTRRHSATLLIAGACALAAISVHSAVAPLFANTSHGKDLFERRCTGCHALDHEKTGPRLRGVFGRPAGSVPSFPYSEAIRNSRIIWDASSLDKWLTDPDAFVPDNDMAFRVTNPEERTSIIEYLKELSQK
jgi:cytochrome c